MTATVQRVVLRDLLRDTRHLGARAASDLADWLVYLEVAGKSDRTLYAYQRELALLLREYPDTAVEEFTAADVTYVLSMKPSRSRHQSRSIFNTFFQWAEDQDRLDRSPMSKVPKMRHPKRRPKDIFSQEEVALLEGLPSPDGPLLTLMFQCGLRKSECRHLRREHINLNRATLIVYHGKGDKDRIVNLFQGALAAVADLDLIERLRPQDHLWGTRKGRRDPIGDTTFDRWWGGDSDRNIIGVLEQAGIARYLNVHQTRHTYGHLIKEHGFDLEERSKMMGHESTDTTSFYYGRVTSEDIAAKIARLGL